MFAGYLLDPHTGVAKHVADRFREDRPLVIAATAHPGKFADDMLKILGQNWTESLKPTEMLRSLTNVAPLPEMHQHLNETLLLSESKQKVSCKNDYTSMVEQVGHLALSMK